MRRFTQRLPRMVLLLLLIEFLDELVYGATEAAWPLIRDDLGLSYTQIGLALALPGLVSIFIEPLLGVLGDGSRRRTLVLGGGVVFCAALALYAAAPSFEMLLLAAMLFYPASGAFVSLTQTTLMDLEPQRHEQNMARWTFAGSAGVVAGPLLLSLFILLGLGWRGAMGGLAFVALAVLLLAWRGFPLKPLQSDDEDEPTLPLLESLRRALLLLKRGEVLRWVVLLEFSDLMMDVLYSFLALYFVDVVKIDPGSAALAVSVWTVVGLAGDFLLIPLLERVKGLDYLRVSVVLELILYPAFLLVEPLWLKLVLLGVLGFFNSGWYSILKGNLYSELGKQSAAMLVLDNAAALVARFIPLGLGVVAQRFGLGAAMWLLLLGPLALLVGLPRKKKEIG
ncbi:MAG: MFS transporter [Anaerolineaceae bacterium]|nr:MFS transporter [Anaerolineaceae bacterium]